MATALSRTDWSKLIRTRVWPFVKNTPGSSNKPKGAATVRGLQAEAFFRGLLTDAGVDHVQSYQNSGVDGGIPRKASADWRSRTMLEKLLSREEADEWLTFDVKYFEYISDQHGLDYPFRPINVTDERDVSVYVLVFEALDDYVAIVPRRTYNEYSDFGYGIHPLMLKVMAWCFPYMVHKNELKEAIDRLLAAKADSWYVNPTTGVEFHDWIPKIGKNPPFFPRHHMYDLHGPSSLEAVIRFLTAINKTGLALGIQADQNPLAPLICDFVLNCGLGEPVRIEHQVVRGGGQITFRKGHASPFSKNRLWHFVIVHIIAYETEEFICIPRHRVNPSWADHSRLSAEMLVNLGRFKGPDGLLDLLKYIQSHSAEAIKCADDVIAAATPGEMVDEELISTNADMGRYRIAGEDERAKILLAGRKQHARGLPWLCPKLNDQAAEGGELFFQPLDVGHPFCNHLGIKFAWSQEDQARYDSPVKRLPRYIFDRSMQDQEVVALRFADYSGGESNFSTLGWQVCPAVMREAYWLKPATEQQFITVYSMLPPKSAQIFDSYGIMPSSHTTQFGTDERREKLQARDDITPEEGQSQEQAASDARCAQYFDQRPQIELGLAEPKSLKGSHPAKRQRFIKGSKFTKDHIDPVKNAVKLGDGSLYSVLRELIADDIDEEMVIKPSQGTVTNESFEKAIYKLKTKDALQAMWDFGLTRRARRASKKQGQSKEEFESGSSSSDEEYDEDEGDFVP